MPLESSPNANAVTPARLVTCLGTKPVAPLWPSWPKESQPHVHSVPSERIAALVTWSGKLLPPAILVTPVSPIGSGRSQLVVVPSPSSPQKLSPQAQTPICGPATARVAKPLLATWVTPLRPGTAAGL